MTYSWDAQLAEIRQQIAAVMGAEVLLSERAKQALLATEMSDNGTLDDASVLCELLCTSPSCALALTEIGWSYDWVAQWRPKHARPTPPMPNLARRLLQGMDESSSKLTPAAAAAKDRRLLTDTDILLSITETTISEDDHGYIATLAAHWIQDGWIDNSELRKKIKTYHTREELRVLRSALSQVAWLDPSHADQQFAIFLDESGSLRLRPFAAFGSVRPEGDVSAAQLQICRGGLVQPVPAAGGSISGEAIGLLEELMNSRSASERDFQQFFERNPDLLAGVDYDKIHPHLILHRDEGSLVPDFFLEGLSSGFCDILDLKLPYDTLVRRLRGGRRAWFRSTVEEAKAQLLEYRSWFDDPRNRDQFYGRYGLRAFQPRMILVVGRKQHFRDEAERINLQGHLPRDLVIWTYDDIVERARRFRQLAMFRRQ